MISKADRIKELTGILNRASKAYYMQDTELMSNYEYDAFMMNWYSWRRRQASPLATARRFMWVMKC